MNTLKPRAIFMVHTSQFENQRMGALKIRGWVLLGHNFVCTGKLQPQQLIFN